jgi:hypothetical protein
MENIQQPKDQFIPVFQDIENMDTETALNILIQASAAAQGTGCLNIRDSVLLAKAIDVIRPGSI